MNSRFFFLPSAVVSFLTDTPPSASVSEPRLLNRRAVRRERGD